MQKLDSKAVWLFFVQYLITFGVFAFFAAIFFLSTILRFADALEKKEMSTPWGWIILAFILYVAFCYLWAKLTYKFWKYQLTEDAIKIEKGVIWKKYISIPYERIQNVDIYRGILARILGLSDLQIQTAGYSVGPRGHGMGTEGKLPGVSVQTAEQLREDLIKRAKGLKQGL